MSYALGQGLTLSWSPTFTQFGVTVTVTRPDGGVDSPTPSSSQFNPIQATYTPTMAGRYVVRWAGTGTTAQVYVDVFEVDSSAIAPICSLTDIKAHLNIPTSTTTNDSEMLNMALAISDEVESYLGYPLRQRTVTERYDGGTAALALRTTPCPCAVCVQYSILTVSAVVENGVTLTSSDYVLDARRGMLRRGLYGYGWEWLLLCAEGISVTYTTGYSQTPPWARQAFLRAMANSWQRTQQRPHPGLGQAPATDDAPASSQFTLPYPVQSMLNPHKGVGW